MRYFVTTPDGEEKGPYDEDVIRGWLREGSMPGSAPVRAENESTSQPASAVFPSSAPAGGFAPPAAPPKPAGGYGAPAGGYGAPAGGFGAPQPPFGASPGAGAPPANIYAPPVETGGDGWVTMNQGNFWQGFALGFFCGCIGLIISYASSSMGSETKRGVRIGFAVQFAVGMLFRLMALAAR